MSANTEVLVGHLNIGERVVNGGGRNGGIVVGFGQIVVHVWSFVMGWSTFTFQSQSAIDLIVWLSLGGLGLDLGGESRSDLDSARLGDLDSGGGSHKGGEG